MRSIRSFQIAVVLAAGAAGLVGCAIEQSSKLPAPLTPNLPGAQRVELPDVLGTPVVVVAPELSAVDLPEGARATFEIEFTIDLRGSVTGSNLRSSSHPALAEQVLAQHRSWVYAVATRDQPCRVTDFRGLQKIQIERSGGTLKAQLEPATVLERLGRRDYPKAGVPGTISVPNYRNVLAAMPYPAAAQRQGIEADLAVLIEFAHDGTVKDAFPVNAAYDKWGFTQAALRRVTALRMEPAPGQIVLTCVPLAFRLRW